MQEMNLTEQEQPVGGLNNPIPAPAPTMMLCSYGTKLTREELASGHSNPQTRSPHRRG
jgi:hypothetical protein